MSEPRIVCAACKHTDGRIVCGPRHFDDTMWKQILGINMDDWEAHHARSRSSEYPPPEVEGWGDAEQGFIDQFGAFYTREEAWVIADKSGQILEKERNWCPGSLHSEHLY
jgi:hypothetical protein